MKNLHFGIFVIYAIFIVIVTYFHLNWSLAFTVVVFKSKWGIVALMRSSDLVKGIRSVSLLLILYGCAYWHTKVPIGTPNPSKIRVYLRCLLVNTHRIVYTLRIDQYAA
ncbi:hypothetical protein Hanom_Chr08g00688831 [Helianthus anomalus]